jgi:hypothetical protein
VASVWIDEELKPSFAFSFMKFPIFFLLAVFFPAPSGS